VTVGVPALLGQGGVEKVIELSLGETEQAGFRKSIDDIRMEIERL
jgi:malate dehydrogenase